MMEDLEREITEMSDYQLLERRQRSMIITIKKKRVPSEFKGKDWSTAE